MAQLSIDPLRIAYFLVALAAGLTVHEAAHALVAGWLGDPTGRRLGRISLNPLRHLDPTGTMMMIVASLIGIGIGWAKPVPVNPSSLRTGPRTGMALVAVAGPAANLLLAAVLSFALQQDLDLPRWLLRGLLYVVLVNVSLAIFNLLPLPPLDGFRVLVGVLPSQPALALTRLEQFGPGLLLLLVFFGGGLLRQYIDFFEEPILRAFGLF